MAQELIGVIDIGKTKTCLRLIDGESGQLVSKAQRPSSSVPGPMRELDVAEAERWLVATLAAMPGSQRENIRVLVPIAHGAAAVLVDGEGRTVVAPDYEDPVLDSVAEDYRPLRDPFQKTYSPFLPLGLNLGRQLYYLQSRLPRVFERGRLMLLHPQYWAWRLSSVAASELTSLGCHTDLWRPLERQPSELSRRQGWHELLPGLRGARELLGTVTPEVAARTGLDAGCRVACGIHDSNASFLSYLIGRPPDEPFAVVSSGTWTVIMASGVDATKLREPLDMLLNVDALGRPTATARFMGGREYEAIAGEAIGVTAELADAEKVIGQGAYALPAFANAGGPFAQRTGQLMSADGLNPPQRAALATLYVALMTDYLLEFLNVRGEVIVDGPLGENKLYVQVLASLRVGNRVSVGDAGATAAAAGRYLAGYGRGLSKATLSSVSPVAVRGLKEYREEWRERAAGF